MSPDFQLMLKIYRKLFLSSSYNKLNSDLALLKVTILVHENWPNLLMTTWKRLAGNCFFQFALKSCLWFSPQMINQSLNRLSLVIQSPGIIIFTFVPVCDRFLLIVQHSIQIFPGDSQFFFGLNATHHKPCLLE